MAIKDKLVIIELPNTDWCSYFRIKNRSVDSFGPELAKVKVDSSIYVA